MSEMEMFSVMFFGVWAFVGAVFLLITLILRKLRLSKEQKCTMTVPATVVELAYHRNQSGGAYYPVVEFAVNGESVRVKSGSGSRPARYEQGQRVTVCYDPDKPKRFYIEGDGTLALLEKIFLFIGLGCILIGSLVSYFVTRMA